MSDDYFALLHLDLACDDPARIRAAVAATRGRCSQGTMSGLDKMACEQFLARLPERALQRLTDELQKWDDGSSPRGCSTARELLVPHAHGGQQLPAEAAAGTTAPKLARGGARE